MYKRREKLYAGYIIAIKENREEAFIKSSRLNENDELFFKELREKLADISNPAEKIAEVRKLFNYFNARFEECLNTITKPLIENSYDLDLEALIQEIIRNADDARIISDAYNWVEKIEKAVDFMTIDMKDVYKNRIRIYQTIKNHRLIEEDPLKFQICTLTNLQKGKNVND